MWLQKAYWAAMAYEGLGRFHQHWNSNHMKHKKRKKTNNPLDPLWNPETYEQMIDDLAIDAKYKDLLKRVLACTVKTGKRIIEVGKKIIEIIIWALKKHPDAVTMAVIGAILALIAAHIPIIGMVLTPIIATATVLSVASDVLLSKSVKRHIDKIFGSLI